MQPRFVKIYLDTAIDVVRRRSDWDTTLKQAVIEQLTDYFYNHSHSFFFMLKIYDIRIDIFIMYTP